MMAQWEMAGKMNCKCYPLVMTHGLPWKIHQFLIGKSSCLSSRNGPFSIATLVKTKGSIFQLCLTNGNPNSGWLPSSEIRIHPFWNGEPCNFRHHEPASPVLGKYPFSGHRQPNLITRLSDTAEIQFVASCLPCNMRGYNMINDKTIINHQTPGEDRICSGHLRTASGKKMKKQSSSESRQSPASKAPSFEGELRRKHVRPLKA